MQTYRGCLEARTVSPIADHFFLSWDSKVLKHRGAAQGHHPHITLALDLAACRVPPAAGHTDHASTAFSCLQAMSAPWQPFRPLWDVWGRGERLVRSDFHWGAVVPVPQSPAPSSTPKLPTLSSKEIPAQNLLCSKTQRFLLAPEQGL